MPTSVQEFNGQSTKTVKFNYLRYLPADYQADTEKRWPFILFLHGMGERGHDFDLLRKYNVLPIVEAEMPDFPAIIVSPQCPALSTWIHQLDALSAFLDELENTLAIDPQRIYVMGYSMGAEGAWELLAHNPQRFAAAVPICGITRPELAPLHHHIPTWIFHGAVDDVVPMKYSDQMYDALRLLDANVQYTIYHSSGHLISETVYRQTDLYEWLFKQVRTGA